MITPGVAQATLDAWATGASLDVSSRFASALSTTGPDAPKGAADIAVLLRQCLRADDEHRLASMTDRDSFVRAWLEVPICRLFPKSFEWLRYGLLRQGTGTHRVRITAEAWRPEWLDVPDGMSVDGDSARGHHLSHRRECPGRSLPEGDRHIVLVHTRRPDRERLVRSAMALPAGATLVVNLPTGAGKTLAMLAAAETASPGMTSCHRSTRPFRWPLIRSVGTTAEP